MSTGRRLAYDVEKLYEDQEPHYALETIPLLISWLGSSAKAGSFRFNLREHSANGSLDHDLTVSWDLERLQARDPRLVTDLQRFWSRKTLMLEDQAKFAAYGLALVAISCLLKRRVLGMSFFRAPDLLLDDTPGDLKGVEVAGRGSKGYTAFAQAINGAGNQLGKRARLVAMTDVSEAYLSLWCRDPMVSVWEKVKP